MQGMSGTLRKWRWRAVGWIAGMALLLWARDWLWQAAAQLFWSMLIALCAMPVMKRLERRLPAGLAAGLSLAALGAVAVIVLFLLLPPLIEQSRELASLLPGLFERIRLWLLQARAWLEKSGIHMGGGVQNALLIRGEEVLSAAAPAVMGWIGGMAGSMGQWLLAPVFAFYFLRDRRRIARRLMSLLPVQRRKTAVRVFREMRRETAGYLRGQMMISAIVGGVTATGLLFCGVPAWLALGALMGALELIPYAGPFLGGVLTALFAFPLGIGRMLWALGVIAAVQQLEGSVLSPKLISSATRLHPVVILLCVTIGGAAGGIAGVLLSAPLLLCLRAALRVISQRDVNEC